MSGEYRAAFLQFDITPNVSPGNPAYLQGMAGGVRKSTAVAVPLSMEICMLEDEDHTRLIFVTADILGFDKSVVESVRQHAFLWGIEPEGIVLNASHTHYAPGTMGGMHESMGPFYKNYTDQLINIIVSSLSNLYERLEPCTISAGTAEATVGVNRRVVKGRDVVFGPNPEGACISDTPLITLALNSSRKTILWVNHGCHPTGMGADTRISADYPGVMKQLLTRGGTAHGVMFFQGAAGTCKAAIHRGGEQKFSTCLADVRQNGQHLAAAVKDALGRTLQPISGRFFSARREMVLPLKPSAGGMKNNLTAEIQMVCLGDRLRLLTFPMEPAAELVEKISSLEGFSSGDFFLGYTNGLTGYLPTDRMIEDGGYETEQSHLVYQIPAGLDIGTENRVVDTVKDLLIAQNSAGGAHGYETVGRPAGDQAFFVLSAGRCGTMTLAHLLNTATNADVWHHPQPDPIREALLAWWKKIDLSETFWCVRSPVIRRAWSRGRIHGETDLLMTPFSPIIAQEIPQSKFIILVRDPVDFVRSGMRRNYYRGHDWDIGRLRPKENSPDYRKWAALNHFEKVCWLWNETYGRIIRMAENLPPDRKRIVKFEDLVSRSDTTKSLFSFLGLDGFDEEKISAILKKKLNAQSAGHFPPAQDWSETLRASVEKHCGKVRSYFGYAIDQTPVQGAIRANGETSRADNRPKLLFLEQSYQSTGGHLDHIVRSLGAGYNVKYLKTVDLKKAQQAIEWADIVWLEWANQLTAQATNKIPQLHDKKVVCRLHGYEVFSDMPAKINWDRVHRLVFVAKHKQGIFQRKFGRKNPTQIVVRNGVDIDRFSILQNKTNTKKLVLLGHLNFRKGLPILLHFYQQLLQRDPSFYLYIRGEFQDPRLEMATKTMIKEMDLAGKLEFVDWVDDLNAWLADKSHILSFSLEESFHYAIGNGMAAGLKPVIHAWNESREIWPNEFIFKDLDQFLSLVMDDTFQPDHYRQRLIDLGLTAKKQVDDIENMLRELADTNGDPPTVAQTDQQGRSPSTALEQTVDPGKERRAIAKPRADDHPLAACKPDGKRALAPSDFSNRNELGLWLHRDESIKPYMNIEYVLKKQAVKFDDGQLTYFLQDAFHRICTSYFNYSQIAPYDYKISEFLVKALCLSSTPVHGLKTNSKAALLVKLFGIIKERLPHSNQSSPIEIRNVFQGPGDTGDEEDATAKNVYASLQSALQGLWARNMCSLFIVHGSMSTLDYTRFSDIDTQIFLTDDVFASEKNVESVARTISEATRYLKFFDPLQHHGYFIATDMDRAGYPQAYLPFETMACGTVLFGEPNQLFHERSSRYENQVAVWNISSFFRKASIEKYVPASPFEIKQYLSRFSMLPVLFLELFQDIYPYKRESFTLAKPFFTPELWEAYEIVSQVREKWNPAKTIRFSQRFYDLVWAVAEMMLTHLRESADE